MKHYKNTKKENNIVNKNGITLIVLIITIIVLLILAGISISMLTGDNGILNNAKTSKNSFEIAEEKNIIRTATLQAKDSNRYEKIEIEKLQLYVDNIAGEGVCEIFDAINEYRAFFQESGRWYKIDKEGNVEEKNFTEELDGLYVAETEVETLNLDGAIVLSTKSTATPSLEENLNYIWSTSDKDVATVTVDGIVKCGTKKGTAVITCKGSNSTKAACTVTTTANIIYSNNENSSITINGENSNYLNPTIPQGYSAINTNDAEWKLTGNQTDVNKGLVIMDRRGNQFVWVPVKNVINNGVDEIQSGYTPMTELRTNSTTNYQGIYYTFDGATVTRERNSDLEPAVLNKTDLVTGDETKGVELIKKYVTGMNSSSDAEVKSKWSKELQDQFNLMTTKTDLYGGFWISRYETSYDTNRKRLASIAGVKAAIVDEENTKTWYGMYQKIKDYSDNKNYKSIMLYGCQYQAMLNWMASNSINVNHGIESNTSNIGKTNKTHIAGNINYNDKICNIYELGGGAVEWTQEPYQYSGGRKAYNTASNSLSSAYGFNHPDCLSGINITKKNLTSRMTLYINN